MKFKKIAGITLATALTVSMTAAACPVYAETGDVNEDLSGSLTLWYNTYYDDELTTLIEGFNKQYPNVDVNYEIKNDADYVSIVKTAFQSGAGPDLLWTHGTKDTLMRDLAANDMLEDLSAAGVDFSFCPDDAMKICKIDDEAYCVPWLTLDTRTCYYNVDMFKENGWEVPKTISDLEKLMATIKDTTDIIPLSQAYYDWGLEFIYEPMLAANAPEFSAGLRDYSVSVTDKPARETLQKLVDWADAGYFGDNWTGVQAEDAMVLAFSSGTCAMMIAGSWVIPYIQENNPDLNFAAVTIGSDDGHAGLVGTYSTGFSVNKNSENKEAAVAFANYCASKEAQEIWIQVGNAVSGTDEIESTNEIAKEIVSTSDGTVYEAWQSVLSDHSEDAVATAIFSENLPKVFSGELTVDEYMDMIQAEME